ncbi:MAG TPA: DUF5985 family protein [Chthoniobacterales bacterium]
MEVFKFVLSLAAIAASATCTVLLFRGYCRKRVRLLMWSAFCFAGLTLNNLFLFCDLVVFPDIDLRPIRLLAALTGMLFLLYGFIWDTE